MFKKKKKTTARARSCSQRRITAALVLLWERGVGHQGAVEALEVLSGSQRGEDEGGQHRSQVEAWEEEALSYLEAQGDPWEGHRVLWVACP